MKWDNLSLFIYDDQGAEHNVKTRVHQANCASCNKDNIWYNHREVAGWVGMNNIPRPSNDSELSRLFPIQEITNQNIPEYLSDMPEDVRACSHLKNGF